MAGNYYQDPRPFYGLGHHNLVPMDEVFYGKAEPWYMHQMPSYGPYDDHHYRSRSVDHRRPDQQQHIQSYDHHREYKQPHFRDDTFTNSQHQMKPPGGGGGGKGNQGHNNQGHNNHGNQGHNNHGGGNNQGGGKQKKQKNYDSDEGSDDDDDNHHKGNKNKGDNHNHNHGSKGNSGHGHMQGWNDNRGFTRYPHHRRSLFAAAGSLVMKKLGLRSDSSSDSSDDERRYKKKVSKGHGHGHRGKSSDHKPYTVRFDDQLFYGHHQGHGHGSNQNEKHKGVHGLGEDHGSHNSKKGGGGGHGGNHPQGILKKGKNSSDHGYSSEDENRGHKGGKKGGGGGQGKLGRSQSMDFRVNLCCENCERKVRKSLKYMDDVDEVVCDQWNNRVVVMGNAKPDSVLKKLRKVKKDTHLWQHHK